MNVFASAARTFAAQVRALPEPDWTGPGLGEWDLRALVGHTSRSLITVSTYLTTAAEKLDVTSPADYYMRIREVSSSMGTEAIVERGRQAGRDLGDDPATTIEAMVERVLDDVAAAGDPLIEVIGGLGIRLSDYLPTRTFELVVHGLDIARATGVAFTPAADTLAEACALATELAVLQGDGSAVLLALTGRSALPEGLSVV